MSVGRNNVPPARPDGGQGRDLVHPGLVSMPGSSSILAALPPPFLRSTARETLPQPRLPGDLIPKACVFSVPCTLTRVGITGPNLDAGSAASFGALRNFSTSRLQLAGDAARDGAKSLHSVSAFHSQNYGAPDGREVVKD